MELYRYIAFERLKEVVESRKLFFVNPFLKWPDTKEGVLYRLAQDINKLNDIDNMLTGYEYKNQIINQLRNGGIIKNANNEGILDWFGMRCQSWSQNGNSLEMWNTYSYNNRAVCMSVDTSRLLSLHSKKQKVEGFSVKYKSKIDISEELQQAIGRHGEFYFPFILRSKLKEQFDFENEYRLYVLQLDSQGNFIGENHEGVYIDIDCEIDKFINEVSVHPNATEEFVDFVEKYVAGYNISFRR